MSPVTSCIKLTAPTFFSLTSALGWSLVSPPHCSVEVGLSGLHSGKQVTLDLVASRISPGTPAFYCLWPPLCPPLASLWALLMSAQTL